jgi:predicted PurR-regulated permease PerM
VTIVSVLIGSTLLGVLGALLAIPIAASIQILLREYFDPRTLSLRRPPPPEEPPPAAPPANDPAPA